MERKTDCENVVLSAEEKKLLKEIQKHPHMVCDEQKIHSLLVMNLVSPDTDGVNALHEPIPTGTYCVSDFYRVYCEYKKDRFREMSLQSLWLPILVSVITTLTINALQWWLPLLVQWCASFQK